MNIAGYTIIDKIAAGGMSTVYLAEKNGSDERVALKVLSTEMTKDLSFLQRFIDEAEIIEQLRHSAIVPIVEYGRSGKYAYIAMEYLPGGNLREKIDSGLTEADILNIVTRLAEALGYTHLKGVLHLDVTPRNILFRNNGDAVLADFGVSKKYLVPDFENPTPVMGNPRYLSPEQIKSERTDPKTDLYSLGVIFYEMLAGRLPFDAKTAEETAQMHLNEIPEALPEHYSHYQPILDQLLEKIPEQRFHSAGDFLNVLNDLHTSVSVLDDKTVIYPMKRMAGGGNSQPVPSVEAVYNTQIYELDSIQKIPKISDHTDPMPVNEATSPAKKSTGDTILMEAEQTSESITQAAYDKMELPEIVEEIEIPESVEEVKPPKIATLKKEPHPEVKAQSTQSLLDFEQEFADDNLDTADYKVIDPQVLVAVRDDLQSSSLGEKRFSLLNVVVILAMFSGALWLWSEYKDSIMQFVENKNPDIEKNEISEARADSTEIVVKNQELQTNQSSRQKDDNAGKISRSDSSARQKDDNSASIAVKPQQQAVAQPQRSDSRVTMPDSVKQPDSEQAAIDGLTGYEEIDSIPLTEIVLEPDTGIELSDDQFIISHELERTLKLHTETLQRRSDGSLSILLEKSTLYQSDVNELSRDSLNLLSRLSFVFRNNQDFLVQVTDRTTSIDTPDGYRFSSYRANNIKDFLIAQGLPATRVTSDANSPQYRSSFSGIEIRLLPNLENLATNGNSNDPQVLKRP